MSNFLDLNYVKFPILLTKHECPPECRDLEKKAKNAANMEAFMAEHQDQVKDCMKLCAATDPNDQAPTTLAKESVHFDKSENCGWLHSGATADTTVDTYGGSRRVRCCQNLWGYANTSKDRQGNYYYCDFLD